MKLCLIIIIILCLQISCTRRDCGCAPPYQVYYLQAFVSETSNLDCSKPVLDFTEDSVRIHTISGVEKEKFVVTSLSSQLNIQNRKLYVLVRSLTPQEEFACTTLGTPLPHLKLVDAKPRD